MAHDAVDLLRTLVEIDSVNPTLVPGGAGESGIARAVSDWAKAAGLQVQMIENTAGRPNVVVSSTGSEVGRTLMICGHLDTVGIEGMQQPLIARIDGDRLYGRGAYDMSAAASPAFMS